jgi:hypothetical protein
VRYKEWVLWLVSEDQAGSDPMGVEGLVGRAFAVSLWEYALSGHPRATSAQAERLERQGGPLLIRGFVVQVPGGAPVNSLLKARRHPNPPPAMSH